MLEDLGAIQARISEIQGRLTALSPAPASPSDSADAGASESPTFGQALQRAQAGAASASASCAGEKPAQSGLVVTPASLGPLPPVAPMPVTPGAMHLEPLHAAGVGTSAYDDLIQAYAGKRGLDPSLVRAVIRTESGGNPRAVSRTGAAGLMQLMPDNVREAGVSDPFDPEQNIAAGTQQLADLMKQYGGDLDLALAGYNAGPGNVRKYGGVPPFRETQNYIRKVRAAMGPDRDGGA